MFWEMHALFQEKIPNIFIGYLFLLQFFSLRFFKANLKEALAYFAGIGKLLQFFLWTTYSST